MNVSTVLNSAIIVMLFFSQYWFLQVWLQRAFQGELQNYEGDHCILFLLFMFTLRFVLDNWWTAMWFCLLFVLWCDQQFGESFLTMCRSRSGMLYGLGVFLGTIGVRNYACVVHVSCLSGLIFIYNNLWTYKVHLVFFIFLLVWYWGTPHQPWWRSHWSQFLW